MDVPRSHAIANVENYGQTNQRSIRQSTYGVHCQIRLHYLSFPSLSLSLFEEKFQNEKPRFDSYTPNHHYIRSYVKTCEQCNNPPTQCLS